MSALSEPSIAFAIALALTTIASPILAALCILRARRTLRERSGRLKGVYAATALALLLIPAWLWACIYVEYRAATELLRCRQNLGRAAYAAILEYRLRQPGRPLPARWPGLLREPVCRGSGIPLPYLYIPVSDLAAAATADPPAILACCPQPHARPWWALRLLPREDRVLLDARGTVSGASEKELQPRLHAISARPTSN
ncbi:MAG TPA: hypothetical protein P5532_22655 [Planctomycetota bacterium]|mgnify:CR=1 FL=1|nr:hypothetical protein [Planctomycetota bacterium]HRT97228.1 hypothetical protein [Planctomycetota bacterium]